MLGDFDELDDLDLEEILTDSVLSKIRIDIQRNWVPPPSFVYLAIYPSERDKYGFPQNDLDKIYWGHPIQWFREHQLWGAIKKIFGKRILRSIPEDSDVMLIVMEKGKKTFRYICHSSDIDDFEVKSIKYSAQESLKLGMFK